MYTFRIIKTKPKKIHTGIGYINVLELRLGLCDVMEKVFGDELNLYMLKFRNFSASVLLNNGKHELGAFLYSGIYHSNCECNNW